MTPSPLKYLEDNVYEIPGDQRFVGAYLYDKEMRDITRIRGVLVEPANHRVRYIVFIEGGFLSTAGKTIIIPVEQLASIDSGKVQALYSRESIQQAPGPEDVEQLTREEESLIRSYFDLEPYWEEEEEPAESGEEE